MGRSKSNSQKRIVVVSDSMPPWNFGGKEERIRLFQQDHASVDNTEIIYCTMRWWKDDKNVVNHVALTKLHAMYTKKNRRSISQALIFALGCFKVARLRPDIIEADQIPIFPVFTLKLVAILTGAKLSVTCHEYWSHHTWGEYLGNTSLGRLAVFIEKRALGLADSLVAVSVETAQLLKQNAKWAEKVSLIPNEIDRHAIDQAQTSLPSSELLFVGRFIESKKIDTLLRALAILNKNGTNLKLTLVGDGPDSTNLFVLIKELELEANVICYGFLPNSSDVYGLMKKCQIFISPSISEGFGFAVVEAWYAGATVVISGHLDNLTHKSLKNAENVIIVDEDTPQAYAEVITRELSRKNGEPAIGHLRSIPSFANSYRDNWDLIDKRDPA